MTSEVVLIVHDDQHIAETIAYVVDDLGHTALITDNGFDALEIARNQHPALIITEHMMRRIDGLQLIAILQSAYGVRCPPIVLLSSTVLGRTQSAKPDAVLVMPWDLQQLEELLERFLGVDV